MLSSPLLGGVDVSSRSDVLRVFPATYLTLSRSRLFEEERELAELDYLCVCDFEATCIEGGKGFGHEIIEFPIVLVNCRTLDIVRVYECTCVSVRV